MFLPYRAKNPPEHVPYVTYSLIGLNTLVYALTSFHFLHVRESAVQAFAVSDETFSLPRLFSAMFLHENLLHIGGNMLFLWIFGASLEGRLRPLKFAVLYLVAGLVGGLLDEVVVGMHAPERFALGASGAIMGLAGAYLWTFPHSIICIFRFWLLPWRCGTYEWKAQWVILYYFALDVFNGMVLGGHDGVAHFAHIGGIAAGFGMALLLRVPRDAEHYSKAQASLATMKNHADLSVYELEALMEAASPSIKLVQTYCQKRLLSGHAADEAKCVQALQKHSRILIEQGDATALASLVLHLPDTALRSLPPAFFLRLGSQLERVYANDVATRVYYRILEATPQAVEAEAAWFRLGRLAERVYQDMGQARHFYGEMLRLFPSGALVLDGQRALGLLGKPATSIAPKGASA